jgi:hypothetical protein
MNIITKLSIAVGAALIAAATFAAAPAMASTNACLTAKFQCGTYTTVVPNTMLGGLSLAASSVKAGPGDLVVAERARAGQRVTDWKVVTVKGGDVAVEYAPEGVPSGWWLAVNVFGAYRTAAGVEVSPSSLVLTGDDYGLSRGQEFRRVPVKSGGELLESALTGQAVVVPQKAGAQVTVGKVKAGTVLTFRGNGGN